MALNEATDLEDTTLHPAADWTKLSHWIDGAETVFAVYSVVVAQHPELMEFIAPAGSGEDNHSYFRQFNFCRRDRGLGGFPWRSKVGRVKVLETKSLPFGPNLGPNRATRFSGLNSTVLLERNTKFEGQVRALAVAYEQGADTSEEAQAASRVAPKALRELVEKRRALGMAHPDPTMIDKYIDDSAALAIARCRSFWVLLDTWYVAMNSNQDLSNLKAQCAHSVILLGAVFFLKHGVVSMQHRLGGYEEWSDRVQALKEIEYREADSLTGTFGYGMLVLDKHRGLLSRIHRAKSLKKLWYTSKVSGRQVMKVPPWLTQDLHKLVNQHRVEGGVRFLSQIPRSPLSFTVTIRGYTDSNRTLTSYCGMGGLVITEHFTYYWWFKFSRRAAQVLQVHVTEMLATLVQLATVEALRSCEFLEYTDNDSTLCAILRGRARCPRFQEMLLLRSPILEAYNITPDSHRVKSADNVHSDHLSRGRFDAFRASAKAAGLPTLVELPQSALPADLPDLVSRLINITLFMDSVDRGPDA